MSTLRFSLRSLTKSLGFAVVAVATLSLGIGVNTAVFSVANSVLFKPLPYNDPQKLVLAYGDWRKRNVHDYPFSNADFFDLREGISAFDDTAALSTGRMIAPKTDGSMEEVKWASVTPNFFRLMGVPLLIGRDFTEADGEPPLIPANVTTPARPRATVLSYEYWQTRFGGDRSVLGRNAPGTAPGSTVVIGVVARRFQLLLPSSTNIERLPDVWFAARLAYEGDRRNASSLRVVARLKANATLEQARVQADTVAEQARRVDAVHGGADFHVRLESMGAHLVAEARPTFLVLLGAATFLLLIACANVASLVIVRISWRQRQLAIRSALGASRWQVSRPLFEEAFILSLAATILGMGVSVVTIRVLLVLAPPAIPRLDSIAIDPWTFLFAGLAGTVAMFFIGLISASHRMRSDVPAILRSSGRSNGLQRTPALRNTIVVAEVALSFVLLIGSGLMLRSPLALQRLDLGFEPRNVLTFELLGNRGGTQPAGRAALQRLIQEKLNAIPGVISVGAANPLPLAGGFNATRWGTGEALNDPNKFQSADFQMVLPGYFETLKSKLIAGRTFTEDDNTPDSKSVVIDDVLAAKAFPHENAIGKRILFLLVRPQPEWVEVIGVVAHQSATSVTETGREQIYVTDGYMGHGAVSYWTVRTVDNPAGHVPAIRAVLATVPAVLMTEVQTMDSLVQRAQARTRFAFILISVFAVIATLLAGIGLYGLLSSVVSQRIAEIGIRVAMGASPSDIQRLIVGYGMRLGLAGLAIGLPSALWAVLLASDIFFGIKPTDPSTFGFMVAIFLLVAAVASWFPARRAARMDPLRALSED